MLVYSGAHSDLWRMCHTSRLRRSGLHRRTARCRYGTALAHTSDRQLCCAHCMRCQHACTCRPAMRTAFWPTTFRRNPPNFGYGIPDRSELYLGDGMLQPILPEPCAGAHARPSAWQALANPFSIPRYSSHACISAPHPRVLTQY